MISAARIVRLLALTVWVGGIIFFAFVVAPVAFTVLPTPHIAGLVVAGSLRVLDVMALVSAVVLLVAIAILLTRSTARRLLAVELVLVIGMAAATAAIQWNILPRMERDRIAAGGDVDAAPATNPARVDFERLHPISEKVEGAVLLLGLGLIVAVGLERS